MVVAALKRRVAAATKDVSDDRVLRRRVVEAVRSEMGFEAFVWLLVDPLTGVGTSPLAEVPSLERLPELVRRRYQAQPRWTALEHGRPHTWSAGAEDPWLRLLAQDGVRDVVTIALGDRFGLWGVLDLWRTRARFGEGELEALAGVADAITSALRGAQAHALARMPAAYLGPPGGSTAVIVLGPDLVPRAHTAETDGYLRTLLPTEEGRRPVPAAAYNVGAHLLAVEAGLADEPPVARAHLAEGRWLTFQAARLGSAPEGDIAVTISPTEPRDRLRLFARAHGLTDRETEVLECLADGADTRAVATRLFLSEFTVQDHLKAVFEKTGVHSRRDLLARARGR